MDLRFAWYWKAGARNSAGPSRNDKDRAPPLHDWRTASELCDVDDCEDEVFELGPEKLLMLLLICLVIFGGKRIPEIGGAIGKGIREFKKGVSDIGESVNRPATDIAPIADVAERREEPKRLN